MPDLVKFREERRFYHIDFSQFDEVIEGDPMLSATVTSVPSGLTVAAPIVTAPALVSAWVSGGVAGVEYSLATVATLASGSIIEGAPSLAVIDA